MSQRARRGPEHCTARCCTPNKSRCRAVSRWTVVRGGCSNTYIRGHTLKRSTRLPVPVVPVDFMPTSRQRFRVTGRARPFAYGLGHIWCAAGQAGRSAPARAGLWLRSTHRQLRQSAIRRPTRARHYAYAWRLKTTRSLACGCARSAGELGQVEIAASLPALSRRCGRGVVHRRR